MNIDQLRYFAELSRCNSMTKASQKLFISQQGLGKAISVIEAEVGTPLATRTKRGTFLTEEGKVFAAFAKKAVEDYEHALEQIARMTEENVGEKRPFTLCITPYALRTVFGPAFDFGGVREVHLEESSPSLIFEALCRGDDRLFVTDLFDNSSLARTMLEKFAFTPLLETAFGLISHKDFPLPAGPITPDDLIDMPLICFRDESIDWVIDKVFGAQPPRNIVLRTSDAGQFMNLVASARAACLLDAFAFYQMKKTSPEATRDFVFLPIKNMPRVTTGFLMRHDDAADPEIFAFISTFCAAFEKANEDYAGSVAHA